MTSKRNLFLVSLAVAIASCAPGPRLFLQYGNQLNRIDVDQVLAANPMAPGENIKVVSFGAGETVSHHIVQVRDREIPHVHKYHDLTVTLVQGQGYMVVGQQRLELKLGDSAFIPRGVPHYFVNTASGPSAGFVIFSPPFDGKDTFATR